MTGLRIIACVFCVSAAPWASAIEGPKLRRFLGNMAIMGFFGVKSEDEGVQEVARAISERRLSGVILYKRNIQSPEQLKALTDFLQDATLSEDPLFIAVDQEGGNVSRLKKNDGFEDYPSHESVAKKYPPYTDAYSAFNEMGAALRMSGINLNFAPVVDLRLNERSSLAQDGRLFSDDPHIVFEYARAFVDAHRHTDVLTTLKHWPGLGSATRDTREGIVDVTQTWNPFERFPYERLIAEKFVDVVMTAHVFHRAYDQHRPATMSPKLIQEMLREKLGFDGVVITDCLQMGAIKALVGDKTEEAAFEAILAGADLMLMSRPELDFVERLARKIEGLGSAQRVVIEGRIVESNRRIAILKERLGGSGPQQVEDLSYTHDEL